MSPVISVLQVGQVVAQGRDALGANTKGEAGVLLGVDAAVDQDVGVDHAAAQDLDPAAVLAEVAALAAAHVAAHVHLAGRLGEGEEVRAIARLCDPRQTCT